MKRRAHSPNALGAQVMFCEGAAPARRAGAEPKLMDPKTGRHQHAPRPRSTPRPGIDPREHPTDPPSETSVEPRQPHPRADPTEVPTEPRPKHPSRAQRGRGACLHP